MTPKHCPVCGRGLSSKYRDPNVEHPRRIRKRRVRRLAPVGIRRMHCSWMVPS